MDKNTIIGLLIMLALLMGFSFWNSSNQKKQKEQQATEIVAKEIAKKDSILPSTSTNASATPNTVASDSTSNQMPVLKTNEEVYFYHPQTNDSIDSYTIETKIAKYSISKVGGYLSTIEFNDIYAYTPKGEPKKKLVLFDGTNNQMNIELMLKNQSRVLTKNCFFTSEQPSLIKVSDGNTQKLSLKLYPLNSSDSTSSYDPNSYVEYLYTFTSNDYRVGFEIRMVNMSKYIYPNTQTFTIQWKADAKSVEKNFKTEKTLTSVFYMDNLSKVSNLNEQKSEKKDFTA
ncbi:MAG TPA: YidC/Oxa1 family insertase periplasmic-domain containing protein, partial [Bacteroidales bacterium]|nr:YidC/Oxa1 family insertase periplasmic-domain containing protein [Bacteroidales bacterium]